CGTVCNITTTYAQYSLALTSYQGQEIFIAFVSRDEGTGGSTLYIDDVTGPELHAPPNVATTPSPANGAVGQTVDVNLGWVNGIGTATVDLYLAQTYDSVANNVADAKKINNTLATSYDPTSDLIPNTVYYWKVVTRNAYGETDGSIWNFMITGTALAGSYDIGGGNNDFPNFTLAVMSLYNNGISDAVTFNVYGGDYNEQVRLMGPIPGASIDDSVKFFDASGTARLRVSSLIPSPNGVIHDSLASYVIFDGIDVYLDHVNDSTYKCLAIKGAKNCIFRNATWRGAGYTASTVKYAINMGTPACSSNVFENLHFVRHNTAIQATGSSAQKHANNIIRNCTTDSLWNFAYFTYHNGLRIYDNDITLNGPGASGVKGIEVNSQVAGDTIFIYRNTFHNLVSAGAPAFIQAYAQIAGFVLNVYNNWFYDVQTTGTATPYVALYANSAGTTNFDFNSVYINDVASTGTVRAIYMSTSTPVLNIRNNIFFAADTTAATYIFHGSSATYVPAILDYNAYYNSTGNANYQVYRTSSTGYATLAATQAATPYEDHGVEGDPGYASASDLHIQDTYNLVSNIGLPIVGIDEDIDREPRSAVNPDIGSDEYAFASPPADYAVTGLFDISYLNPEFTLFHPRARVANRGSAAQTDAPVVLFYNDIPQDTILVSLAVDAADTFTFDWTTPAAPQTGTLEIQSFLTGDADLANDSMTFAVRIIGLPMHGTYNIGGVAPDYTNFSSAVEDITLRGMDDAVVFDVYTGTYDDSLVIGAITGASSTSTIKFQEHAGEAVTITRSIGNGVVRLVGADYVTIDGIDITATGACLRGAQLYNGADYNTIKNCSVTGSNVSATTTYGVHIQAGGNDYNTLDNLTISGASWGIDLYGASATVDIGNEVKNCAILEGKYGVRTYYQRGSRVHDCDIQPGWSTAATEVYGLYVSTQTAGDTVFHYNNKIHNLRTSSTYAANGIYTVGATTRIYNNFIWDFQNTGTGPVYGIHVYGGSPQIYFNSVYIGDVATTGGTKGINGFYQESSGSNADLRNNIFQIDEPNAACWAINRYQGTGLTSNYNCVYSSGPGAAYNMGRDASTNYATLSAWSTATGRDANSVEGNPGYASASNLHIQATFSLVDGIATPIVDIDADIDGNPRSGTPDIGADEYTSVAFNHDYGIVGFIGLLPTYTSNLPYTIQVEVKNNGGSAETDVPVVLFYEGTAQDTVLLSLGSLISDTVDFDWTPPDVGIEYGVLEAQTYLATDEYLDNDSLTAQVTVIGGPMHGTYDLGGGNNDFATFAEALQSLYLRGIDAEVIIDVYDGTYAENVTVTEITGTNYTDRVIFRAHPGALDDIVTITSNISTPCVVVNGADFVTFDGLNMVGTGTCDSVMVIKNDADYVTVQNLSVTGRDSTVLSCKGIRIWINGNDNCLIDNVTVRGVQYGIIVQSGSSGTSSNLEIRNCRVDGVPYCIYVDESPNARVHDNDIQPAATSSTSAYGVYVAIQSGDDSIYVYNNRIHNFRHTSNTGFATVAGVYSASNMTSFVFNNFIWDWQTHGPDMMGIYTSNGTTYTSFNTIRMNETESDVGIKAGIYSGTGTNNAANNIVVIEEATDTCYAIWRVGGTLESSDYNCFYGTGTGYKTGCDGGAEYLTLFDWQATGYDEHSVSGDPGFVGAGDLHIDPTYLLCNNVGLYIPEMIWDIDGDVRNDPPDIGADEYHGLVPPETVDSLTVFPILGTDDVELRWTPSLNANSYKIYASNTVDFEPGPTYYVDETTATSYTHVGVVPANSKMFYIVIASTDEPALRR
ncbi:right-handed parallel beta-helix repeat-containing protein, partial [candidate division KSB1 bacterium]